MAAYKTLALEFFTKMNQVKHDPHGGPPEVLAKLRYDLFDNLRTSFTRDQGIDMRQLLINSRSSEVSEPRDRIYGLLGMLNDEDRKDIEVDYRKPVSRVFVEAMSVICKHGDGPRFLSGMWVPSKPNDLVPDLPSWVPDFTSQTAERAAPHPTNMSFNPPSPRSASGAGEGAQNGKVLEDYKTLQVEALPVDEIDDIITFADTINECIGQLKVIHRRAHAAKTKTIINEKLRSFYKKYRSSEPLWRTLISNKISGYDPAPAEYEAVFDAMLRGENLKNTKTDHSTYGSHDLAGYRQVLWSHLPGRTFFTTLNGLYGLGNAQIKSGDRVTIWFGANTPFVVRTLEQDPSKCTLIGAAYVAGIMNGEMVDELYCEDLLDSVRLYVI